MIVLGAVTLVFEAAAINLTVFGYLKHIRAMIIVGWLSLGIFIILFIILQCGSSVRSCVQGNRRALHRSRIAAHSSLRARTLHQTLVLKGLPIDLVRVVDMYQQPGQPGQPVQPQQSQT